MKGAESERMNGWYFRQRSVPTVLTHTQANLVLLRRLLGQCHHRRHADGQMVPADKVRLALLHQVPVLLQMLDLVAVCGRQVGAHAAVVSGDDHTTSARRLLLVIAVVDLQTGLLVGFLQDFRVLVLTDAADEDDRVGWEQVLFTISIPVISLTSAAILV